MDIHDFLLESALYLSVYRSPVRCLIVCVSDQNVLACGVADVCVDLVCDPSVFVCFVIVIDQLDRD